MRAADFYKILDLFQDAVLVVGRDGLIQHANSTATQLLLSPNLEGHKIILQDPENDAEVYLFRGDGAAVPVTVVWSTIPLGRDLVKIAIIRDASKFVTSRAKLRKAEVHLTEALEKAELDIDQTTGSIAHELAQPARQVVGWLDVLLDENPDLPESMTRVLRRAQAAAERQTERIDGLLSWSRVRRRGSTLKPCSMRACVDQALNDLESQITKAGATIAIVNEMPPVLMDKEQIIAVWRNLVENALKYRGVPTPVIALGYDPPWFFCTDNGRGFDPAYKERIFGLFERLETHTKGHGIGLALCKRVVERHGGTITAESKGEGRGSTFRFCLYPLQSLGTDSNNEHPRAP